MLSGPDVCVVGVPQTGLVLASSEDDSKDLSERSDLSITLFCDSNEADTRVNSDQVLSDGDFPEESVPKDK